METLLVDSNIPMYANGSEHPYKKPCQEVLRGITHEKIPSTDTHFDQVSEVKRLDPEDFAGGGYNGT